MDKNNRLETIRHSTSHLLAAAVQELFPGTKFGVGPAIESGFYYDFDFQIPTSEAELPRIEQKMRELKNKQFEIVRKEETTKQALNLTKGQPYKSELIQDLEKEGESQISFYTLGDFEDLCKGPHVENTSDIGAFKLLSVAGAYWKGSEKNKMLTRIYGTAFETQKELDDYLHMLEESKKRDHRKLGKELELFTVPDEVGPGLFIWLPNGETIINEIQNYERGLQLSLGYQHVKSPHIGKKELWVKSGHWDLYRDKMYSPMEIDNVEYLVKPMSCPMHIQVYKNKKRSYRDLPLRIAEVASVYRYEQSGELSGLARVRYFNQDDAHIFCTPDQVKEEISGVIELLEQLYRPFGLSELEFWLTLRSEDKKDKYLGSDEVWQRAEDALESALREKSARFIKMPGEAKFYGPSIDVMVKDSLGRKWQCGTVQVDFALPQRFELEYIGATGTTCQPVMVHRAPLGSLERFMSIIIEHFAGSFPVWLSPIQVQIIPITDKHKAYGQKVLEQLTDANIRAELDSRSEKMQAKIREAQLQKIPYMLIVGDKEMAEDKVAVRTRNGKDKGAIKFEDFLTQLEKEIAEKSLN